MCLGLVLNCRGIVPNFCPSKYMQGNTQVHISRQLIIQDYVGLLHSLVINEKFFMRSLNIVDLFLKNILL